MTSSSSGQSSIRIRRATPADVTGIAPLFDAYRQFYDCPADLEAAATFLDARLSNNESIVFVAENSDGAVIGFTQLYPTFCSVENGPILVLYDLFVAPQARTLGAGHALMRAAQEYGQATGAVRMDLSTQITNTTAQSVYESLGWQRDAEFYHYSFHPGTGDNN